MLALAAAGAWVVSPLPPDLVSRRSAPGVVLLDRHGVLLRATRAADGSRHRWIRLEEMDPDLIAAFITSEDRRFHRHFGIDWRGAGRAALDNMRARGVVSGASTISMQLARLLRPVPRTWSGKARQALWALRLERHLGKQQILEQYLNRIPLGQGAVGVEAAASLYFGASASDVSLGQAAILAGIARSPSAWSPFTAPARAAQARDRVLDRMQAGGYARAEAVARTRTEPVASTARASSFLAPHFTTRLLATDSTGASAGGVRRTSLDAGLQAVVEAEVRHTTRQLAGRGGKHAAAVVLDNATGEVLAWVGSPDFWSDTAGQVDMVTGLRQPGSALKPFLYALAFDRGFTAATILPDLPRVFHTAGGPYAPRNYDRQFRGPVRIREALASSYNVPAVDLADRMGTAALLETLHRAGFTSLDRGADHYGLGLALGNGEVSLIELANGYRALASGGVWRPWRTVPGLSAERGGRRVVSSQSAALVLHVLADPVARIPGFGTASALDLPFPIAAKTGTSRHFTDNWAVGTTERFTVAVWVGNFDGTAMDGVSGVSGAGPLLHRVALETARRYDPGALPPPASAGLQRARVCLLSGLLATGECAALDEWFMPGTVPERQDDWQRDGAVRLPVEYAEWARSAAGAAAAAWALGAAGSGRGAGSGGERSAGAEGNRRGSNEPGELRIVSPRDGDRYRVPPGVRAEYATIPLQAAGAHYGRLRWKVDGVPVDAQRWRLVRGTHVIEAAAPGARDTVVVTVD